MKIKHNNDLYKTFILIEKFLYKFRIYNNIILFGNANFKAAKCGLAKTQMAKAKNINGS